MNIKNFFPNIPDEDFTGFKEAIIECATVSYKDMDEDIKKVKKIKGDKWDTFHQEVITTKMANNLAKYVMKSVEKTACGFAMIKEEEQFIVFETFIEMFGPKQGVKNFQEHIKKRREDFEKIKEKFPNIKKISDKY